MAKSTFKISGALQVGELASAPSNPSRGMIYVDSGDSKVYIYNGSSFQEIQDEALLDAILGTLPSPSNYTPSEATHSGHLSGIDTALGSKADSSVVTEIDANVDDLITLSGVAENSSDLGTFTGGVISDNVTIKAALQELETEIESVGGSNEFSDDVFRITDNVDGTKKIAFEASTITTSTVRTITMPDADVDLGQIATNQSNISTNSSNISSNDTDIADLVTLSGVAANSSNLGTFTGTTIADSETVKGALQDLEDGVELKADSSVVTEIDANVDDLITLSGVAENATDLGTFTGTTIADSSTVKAALQSLETEVELKIDSADIGQANGVASLDGSGKLPSSQLPTSATEYKGAWNASTNSPALADGAGTNGDLYRVSVSGSQDLGSGSISFVAGDAIIYNGSVWEKIPGEDIIQSVNGATGVVVLDADDIDDAATTNKFATSAQLAKVDFISVTQAVDLDSVESLANSALQSGDNISELVNDSGFISELVSDTTPELGGDLTLGANVLIHDGDGMKRGSSSSNYLEEEYVHSVSLSASQTGTVISAFTFAHASFDAVEIAYKLKDSAGALRVGTLRIVTDGTSVSINDAGTELGDSSAISFDAAVNGANIEVSYDSGANTGTLRADVKRFLV